MGVARLRSGVGLRRSIPAALAIVLIAAQGAALAHFAIVKHTICPLHGELIHPGAEKHEAHSLSATDRNIPGLYAFDDDSDCSRDEHCGVVGVRREAALPVESGAILPTEFRPVGTPVALSWAPKSESRFRIAPKQSPPA